MKLPARPRQLVQDSATVLTVLSGNEINLAINLV